MIRLGDVMIITAAAAVAVAVSVANVLWWAPSVITVRPELADVGWWTALWSGRFTAWAWYHYPVEASVVSLAVALTVALVAVVTR